MKDEPGYHKEIGIFAGIMCEHFICDLCKDPRNAFQCRPESLMLEHVKSHRYREALRKAKEKLTCK